MIGSQATDPTLAVALTEQLFANAMVSAGLVDDPRSMLNNINNLLTMVSVCVREGGGNPGRPALHAQQYQLTTHYGRGERERDKDRQSSRDKKNVYIAVVCRNKNKLSSRRFSFSFTIVFVCVTER